MQVSRRWMAQSQLRCLPALSRLGCNGFRLYAGFRAETMIWAWRSNWFPERRLDPGFIENSVGFQFPVPRVDTTVRRNSVADLLGRDSCCFEAGM